MNRYYAIFSSRGMWIEVLKPKSKKESSTKVLTLFGRATAEKRAAQLATEHKRKYWVEEVTVAKK